ncbi:MAG: TolC family protein, partial [Planctomycetaceae bacterium]
PWFTPAIACTFGFTGPAMRVNQGVVIARINSDISLTEFEQQVKLMVFDVETLYWDLYQSYRNYDSLVQARDAALQTWRSVKAKSGSGLEGGGRADEAQAREQYFEARSRAETALGGPGGRGGAPGLYGIELQLRRMCGLPANDGRIIRPADEPGYSPVVHDWHGCLATAFARRSELRRQRWIIKSNELQLRAARSLANPQLSFISSYQLNGFGNNLFGPDGAAGSEGAQLQSAYRTQFAGDQTGWNMGLQFSVPLGLRSALTQVRHQELRLIKAQAVLEAQELEVSHELAGAFQSVDYWYQNAETNYNRRQAALENVEVLKADYELGRRPLDLLLQAQNRLAIAEVTWHRSVTEYCKSLAELQLRQGTLLDYNNVYLEEGAWSPEAWRDVERRAWARSHAFEAPRIDPLRSEPEPFAQPAGGSVEGNLQFEGLVPVEGALGAAAGRWSGAEEGVTSPSGGAGAGGSGSVPAVTPLPPGPDELKNRPFAPKLGEGEYFDGGETSDTGEE